MPKVSKKEKNVLIALGLSALSACDRLKPCLSMQACLAPYDTSVGPCLDYLYPNDTGDTGGDLDSADSGDTVVGPCLDIPNDTGDTSDTADTLDTADTVDTGGSEDTSDTGDTTDTGDTSETNDTATKSTENSKSQNQLSGLRQKVINGLIDKGVLPPDFKE